MNGIATQTRAEVLHALTSALSDDVDVHTSMPPTLYPPCVLINEADPFIEPGDTLPDVIAHYEVIALGDQSPDNQRVIDQVDDLIDRLVEGLWEYRPTVAGYQTFTFANQQPYLGARISLDVTGYEIRKD